MAVTTEIPWGDGSGDKIYLTRNASEGDQVVSVSSDANTGAARSQVVTFATGVGNVQRQLTINQAAGGPQEHTITLHPTSYDTTDHSWYSTSNLDRGYTDSDSTTYAQINDARGSNAETWIYYKFDTSSIPENATDIVVTCKAKALANGNSSAITNKQMQLYSGTTAKGSAASVGTSATEKTITAGTWTLAELRDARIRLHLKRTTSSTSTNFYIRFYGATLTITYKA